MTRAETPPLAWRLAAHFAVYAIALTMLLPFAWMVLTSLKSDPEAAGLGGFRVFPAVWRWENYGLAFQAAQLDRFYLNSLVVAVATTFLAVAHNALAGFAFAKMRFRGRRILFGMALATMMLPIQVFFIFAYVIAHRLGYIDDLRALIVPFLASGFGVFYMRQAIAAVPDALLDAGRIDGMGDWELFWNVVRPAAWPAITALAIFTFVNSWNSFFWPLIAVDRLELKTLPLAVADLASGNYIQSWPQRMAAATILVVPLIIVFFFAQRAFVRGVTLTGLKE